jgi:ABC-type phosphate transport system substrate-binding protein
MTAIHGLRGAFFTTLALCTLGATNPVGEAKADLVVVQGSTTFARRLIDRIEDQIKAETGHQVAVVPNKTLPGLIGLIEGRAHIAMISAPLEDERAALQSKFPTFDYSRLRVHDVSKVGVALVVHKNNHVRKASLAQITKILNGEIDNWSNLGGHDRPIRIVLVGGGGGVTAVVQGQLLGGNQAASKNVIYTKTPVQLVQIVEQEPGAIGFAQLELAREYNMPVIQTESPIEQTLSLVTIGAPTPASQSVIDAIQKLSNQSPSP